MTSPSSLNAVAAFLEQFDRLMSIDVAAALAWTDGAPQSIRQENEWTLCHAEALRAALGAGRAAEFLARIVAADPEFGDAHYLLAHCYEQLGAHEQARKHQLETLRLDGIADCIAGGASLELEAAIVAEASRAFEQFPQEVRAQLATLSVRVQSRPCEAAVRKGCDARAFGTVDASGAPDMATDEPVPPLDSITVYYGCLVDALGDDETLLLEQVRATVAREVGQFLVLGEL